MRSLLIAWVLDLQCTILSYKAISTVVGLSHNTTQQVAVYCTPTPKQCLCWCLKLLFILGGKGDKVKCTFFFFFIDRVMVGAPLSNVTGNDGSQLIKYGAVYRCEYTGLQECKVITTDNRRKYRLDYRYYFSS